MSINFRYPNITGLSEREQITQIKSYLHQLVEQLNNELPTIGSADGSAATTEVQGGELSYYELRSLIVQQLQEVKNLFDQLEEKMEDGYVKEEELPEAINEALKQAKESGEFDGKDGVDGSPGEDGVSCTHQWNGTTLEITSASGTSSADLKGDKGDTGAQGVGIASTSVTEDGLIINYSDGSVTNLGKLSFTMDANGNLYYEIIQGGNISNETEE